MKSLPYFSTVIVNPDVWDLACTTIECLMLVNVNKRTRTVHVPDEIFGGKILKRKTGVYFIHGGTAPKDEANSLAETSRLGFYWFSDWPGNKHIRIIADRIEVTSFYVPEFYVETFRDQYPRYVYPDDDVHYCVTCERKCDLRKSHYKERCGFPRFECFSCYESERYREESGFYPGVRTYHALSQAASNGLYGFFC